METDGGSLPPPSSVGAELAAWLPTETTDRLGRFHSADVSRQDGPEPPQPAVRAPRGAAGARLHRAANSQDPQGRDALSTRRWTVLARTCANRRVKTMLIE